MWVSFIGTTPGEAGFPSYSNIKKSSDIMVKKIRVLDELSDPFIYSFELQCDLARLNLLQKTCWVDFTLGSPDWTVRLNVYIEHV